MGWDNNFITWTVDFGDTGTIKQIKSVIYIFSSTSYCIPIAMGLRSLQAINQQKSNNGLKTMWLKLDSWSPRG